ncbi:type II secretion system F family protein [Psychromonas sp. Urea-02u-13]|uniref:type II secretion system F family protein n=1 Tax=Psychromonas sp. Urea-02u-13 TaxID=2058326 RepID=UPI000C3395AD|nr:type II secretion system F family protein [Psychromonas sp. Urea-02u-13]PKG40165.1 pilus assembly protein TadB [Psychromonas sp. Urea-02u-13]
MTFLIIAFTWLLLCILAWLYLQKKATWNLQLQRYSRETLATQSMSRFSFMSSWLWLQNLKTFLGAEKLRRWQLILCISIVVSPLILVSNGMSLWFAVLITFISAGLFVWFAYLQIQQQAMDNFRKELPDVIDGLIRAIRVGSPLADVFEMISMQQKGSIARLFKQMCDELKVGQTIPEVMRNAAQRMPIAEFRFLTIVLSLQQETGGRLADVLSRLSNTLRDRRELESSIQSITSESRNSAKILALLPVFVCLVLFTSGKAHFHFLMTSSSGQMIIAYVLSSILLGLYLIRRMTQLKG